MPIRLSTDKNKNRKIEYRYLSVGEAFKYADRDNIFVAIPQSTTNEHRSNFNAVDIENGDCVYFDEDEEVLIVNATLTLEK